MNEKSFESRRVRTQPWTCTLAIGPALASAALTEIGPDMGLKVAGNWRFEQGAVVATPLCRRKGALIAAIRLYGDRAPSLHPDISISENRIASSVCASFMAERRLILWDIDMTLVNTGAAGQHALVRATIEWFGGEGELSGVEIAGRTDRAIAHQIMEKYGKPATRENVEIVMSGPNRRPAFRLHAPCASQRDRARLGP